VPDSTIDYSFASRWRAQVLAARPAILPARHYVYPREAEEVERGALEVLIQPIAQPTARSGETRTQPFLATCALGFRDSAVPTGLWSTPTPEEICAVSGGYAYMIDTTAPERFTMIPFRPVLQILPVPPREAIAAGLLLFVGHHGILAWGARGEAWRSEKLSDEGVTIAGIEGNILHGQGWRMQTDRETAFALDLRTGLQFP
jgi:hypothetical protein